MLSIKHKPAKAWNVSQNSVINKLSTKKFLLMETMWK